MKVLLVGATGEFAGLVLPELKKRGASVRALVRKADQAAEARARGADDTAVGNLEKPESLESAARGVDGVFHLNPAFLPHEGELGVHMVEAAKRAGVRKFVFSGVIHPSIRKMSNHAEKLAVEEAIYESGMVFTVLQPTMFMQNMKASWSQTVSTGHFALPYSKQKPASYVDYRDVAETAALALTTDRLDYGTFELCARGTVNRVELAALMSEAAGQEIEAGEVTFDEWAEKAHMPQGPMREGLQRMYADYDQYGFPGGNALVLQAILQREPRTLRKFFAELAKEPRT